MVLQQLGGSILEGLGQSGQQHAELGRVELEQRDQHRLGSLRNTERGQGQRSGGHRRRTWQRFQRIIHLRLGSIFWFGSDAAFSVSGLRHLSDVGALGLGGPGDDAGHGQPGLTGVDKVRTFHLQRQRLDVFQDGHLDLEKQERAQNKAATLQR